MFREQFNTYSITEEEIKEQYGIDTDEQLAHIMEEGNYYEDRANLVIERFNKQQIKTDIPPIIKVGITKLSIIHFLAKMAKPRTMDDLVALEKIENNSIKALMYSNTLWGDIANEEASDITTTWYLIVEAQELEELLSMSNALKDKILLRDKVEDSIIYHNWDDHVRACSELNIDPKAYTEQEVQEMKDLLDGYKEILKEAE